jgi:hypothetical protein
MRYSILKVGFELDFAGFAEVALGWAEADDVGGLAEVGLVGEDLDAGALGDGDYGLVAAEVDADGDRLWGWGLLGLL